MQSKLPQYISYVTIDILPGKRNKKPRLHCVARHSEVKALTAELNPGLDPGVVQDSNLLFFDLGGLSD